MRGPDRLRRARAQRGASSVEYALLATLIAVVIVVAVTLLGSKTANLFQVACSSVPPASASC